MKYPERRQAARRCFGGIHLFSGYVLHSISCFFVTTHGVHNSMFLLPLNCNCSQVLHIRAGTFARYSPSIPANVTVRRWGGL